MSGDSPPPKPKPGSLRDRIAAFEHKPQQNAPPPPAPRPKPGHVQWKPRQPSPPPPPVNSGEGAEGRHGMNTADAKESIGSGGMSLKERMAALQGRGAFAPPVPAPAPKPASERKWKPPPAPVALPTDDDKEAEHEYDAPHTNVKSPVSGSEAEASEGGNASESAGESEKATGHPDEQVEETAAEGTDDPEEEERKRRAAIAARLARLGGARIGMGPPVFAPKPRAPPKEEHHARENADEPAISETPEKIDIPNAPSESSLLSPDSASSGRSPPASMPVPSGPKRAAPPRRRPPKSPGAPSSELPPLPTEAEKEEGVTPSDAAERDEKKVEEDEVPASAAEEAEQEEREETEEEAAARRKRIADRLAKSGGINPLAGPRRIQPIEDEEEREKEIATEVGDDVEVEAHEPIPTVVRVSGEALEDSTAEVEEQEHKAQSEVEVPPQSPSEPDEVSQSQATQAEAETIESEDVPPPLSSKRTSAGAEEANKHSQSPLPASPTPLPAKGDENGAPVVDMPKPSEVGKTEVKLDDEKVTEGDSVDITEAVAEYKDVQTHPANEAGETSDDSPPVPDKEVKIEVPDEKDH